MDKSDFVKYMVEKGYECFLNDRGLPTVRFYGKMDKAKHLKRIVKESGYKASWGIIYANSDD